MAWKPLPIGVDNFEELITKDYFFVDKTLFIRDLLDMKGEVNLFTRPRRFGKTLNMSMLRYFFEMEEDNAGRLFAGTKIMSAGEEYLKWMGQFPVISLTLKSMKQATWELSFEMLKKAIREEYSRHWKTVEASGRLNDADRERFRRIRDLKGTDADYADALKFLSECLYICTGRKTIILIDEYDVPLENAHFAGFYEQMTALLRSLFESALKTNENLEFAVMTGCLRISRESILTGLNNLKIMSITADTYAEYFGFTPDEVEAMLRFYDLEMNLKTVQRWYDGYQFGSTEVYNPWSVINYVQSCRTNKDAFARPYWSNTSSNSIVRTLVEKADLSVKQEIEALIEGKTITKPIHEDITYEDMDSTQDNLWNFLFFTGYLKKIREQQEGETIYMEMAIPNSEVRYIYKNTVLRWFEEKTDKKELSPLYESILNGDTEKMADIILKYPSVRGKAVIIEIKVSGIYQGLEEKCDEALRQIEEQKYEEALRQEGYQNIMKYGVAFYRKECMAKLGQAGSESNTPQ